MEMLGTIQPKQAQAKTHVENYFKRSLASESTLESFVAPKKTDFESLMRYFVPAERLKRAEQIKDDELTVTKQTDRDVEATIRDYHIILNTDDKTIWYDCADWGKILATKKLCKHIAKLLLAMDREKATKILERLYAEEEAWQFKPYTDM
jgi:hypothetical protein